MCRPTPSNATGDSRSSGCFVSSKEKGGDRPRAPAACRGSCATPRSTAMRASGPRSSRRPAETTKRCDGRSRRCWRTRRAAERFLDAPIGEVAAHVLADERGASLVGPADRFAPDPRAPRRGRDGRGVSRPRHEAGPRRRHQGPGRRLPFRPRAARALRTRGAGAGDAEPSAHRRDLRAGGGRTASAASCSSSSKARRSASAWRAGPLPIPGGARRSRARSPTRSKRRTRRASSTAI